MHNFDNDNARLVGGLRVESWNQWNQTTFYNLGQPGHLAKLHLAVSQSLLTQELMGCAWNQTTTTTDKLLSQLIGGFRWNHGISGIKQFLQTGNNSYNWSSHKVAPGGVAKPACAGGYSMSCGSPAARNWTKLKLKIQQNCFQ